MGEVEILDIFRALWNKQNFDDMGVKPKSRI